MCIETLKSNLMLSNYDVDYVILDSLGKLLIDQTFNFTSIDDFDQKENYQ